MNFERTLFNESTYPVILHSMFQFDKSFLISKAIDKVTFNGSDLKAEKAFYFDAKVLLRRLIVDSKDSFSI